MLQVAQLRAARALLGWRQEDLAQAAKVETAFEQAGIQFIDDDETGGFGLRMAKKKRKR